MSEFEANKISIKIDRSTWELMKDTQNAVWKASGREPTFADLVRDAMLLWVEKHPHGEINVSKVAKIGDNVPVPEKLLLGLKEALSELQEISDALLKAGSRKDYGNDGSKTDLDPEVDNAIREAGSRADQILRGDEGTDESMSAAKSRAQG